MQVYLNSEYCAYFLDAFSLIPCIKLRQSSRICTHTHVSYFYNKDFTMQILQKLSPHDLDVSQRSQYTPMHACKQKKTEEKRKNAEISKCILWNIYIYAFWLQFLKAFVLDVRAYCPCMMCMFYFAFHFMQRVKLKHFKFTNLFHIQYKKKESAVSMFHRG